jgi:hypothetical protein
VSKRSSSIETTFVSAVAAAALAGCNANQAYHRDWEQCVNKANIVVEDRYCQQPQRTGGVGGGGYYHWWYTRRPYYVGSRITDGYAASIDRSSVGRSSQSRPAKRGGFGSTSHWSGS